MTASHRVLTLAFLRPSEQDHWVNRLSARVSAHPFCHVELFFESVQQCFSVMWGETACFRAKNLSNPNYELISLLVSPKEYDASLEFCRTCAGHNLQFDERGMWLSWCLWGTPCLACGRSSQEVGATFCSKIVTEALQFAGVREVQNLPPATATPSRLYSCVRGSSRVACGSVPYKREALMALSTLHHHV